MNHPQSFKPSGLYPGSGVAPGGQQGRPAFAHNGLSGVKPGGGPTIGASRPRPPHPSHRPMPAVPGAQGFRPADHQSLLAALMAFNPRGN